MRLGGVVAMHVLAVALVLLVRPEPAPAPALPDGPIVCFPTRPTAIPGAPAPGGRGRANRPRHEPKRFVESPRSLEVPPPLIPVAVAALDLLAQGPAVDEGSSRIDGSGDGLFGTPGPGGTGDGPAGPGHGPGGGTGLGPGGEAASTGPIVLRPDVVPPRLVRRVEPRLPLSARPGFEGVAKLRCVIETDGRVRVVQVLRAHPLLEDEAVAAVERWRYEPATLAGRAVAVYLTVDVSVRVR